MILKRTVMAACGITALILVGNWSWRNKPTQAFSNNTAPTVTIAEAVEKVLAANPGTAAVDVNLERENNQLAWEVKLNNDLEVYIDANTKEFVKTEQGWNLADVPFLEDWVFN